MKPEQIRLVLFGAGVLAIVAGVGLSFGTGAALIVAGLVGMAVAVAWAYVAVSA